MTPPSMAAQVVTVGLIAAEMNGRAGVVTGWDAGRARYAVQLEGRVRHAALKPGNLKPRLIAVGLKISKALAETQLLF